MQDHYQGLTKFRAAQSFRLRWFDHGLPQDEQKYPSLESYDTARGVNGLQQMYQALRLDLFEFRIVARLESPPL